MFLDETHNWPRKEEPQPDRRPPFRHEKALRRVLLFYALALLLLPISVGSAVDLVRYIFD
ncbi:hypothetical protein [Sphingomonas sp. OK281]|uniref:hypothetical protein n=1 Tax=Sphingomonas sp. OK281 TaxID=1881067 RepID=UPI0008E22D97|nr:hypothetical protein [Sphingomonas sp. OK281]SFO26205.1 hypothetical protein SAMN05428984_3032 [Sphingomonas sp. OK281]